MQNVKSITKQGYLTKQGGLVRNWRRRWFILRDNVLSYYKLAEDSEPTGEIALDKSCNVHPASRKIGRPNAFELITEDRVYNLIADDKESMDGWITAIKYAMNHNAIQNESDSERCIIRVKGMMCERCVAQVRKVIFNVTKIDDISFDEEEELVTINGKFNVSELQEELEEAGFIPSVQAQ